MLVKGMTAACCLLSAGSVLCTWLGGRMNSTDWLLWGGCVLTVQFLVLAAGVLAGICALARDICRKRGWKVCLGDIARLGVMAAAFMGAAVYHVAVTGGV